MEILKFKEEDFLGIREFMTPIWHKTYSFLPREQVELLLDKYFSNEGLSHYRSEGYEYFKLTEDGIRLGVVVYTVKGEDTYIDKLYLSEEARGRGYAPLVFEWLLSLGRDVTLNVNQSNGRAVACYKKNGFFVESEELIDLGGGMVNRDFNMRLSKNSKKA